MWMAWLAGLVLFYFLLLFFVESRCNGHLKTRGFSGPMVMDSIVLASEWRSGDVSVRRHSRSFSFLLLVQLSLECECTLSFWSFSSRLARRKVVVWFNERFGAWRSLEKDELIIGSSETIIDYQLARVSRLSRQRSTLFYALNSVVIDG